MDKTGRNDPCPCGSGKKFKKCCQSKEFIQIGRENSTLTRLERELLAFCEKSFIKSFGGSASLFWGEDNPLEILDDPHLDCCRINFLDWTIYDWVADWRNNKDLIDLYREKKRNLTGHELEILDKMKQSVLSLFEVREVFPGKGMILEDLLLGGKYQVKEIRGSQSLNKWDILAARILKIDGDHILSGAIYPYALPHKKKILSGIRKKYSECKKIIPGILWRKFLKLEGYWFNTLWLDQFKYPSMPALVNTSKDPLLFSKAVFEIKDENLARERLKKIKVFVFNETDNCFVWLKDPKMKAPTVFGTIKLSKGKLTLECNSKERLGKGKILIEAFLGDAILHKADSFQDPYRVADKTLSATRKKTGASLEENQNIYMDFMDQYYRQFLDQKIPMLGNKSPLEAVKTKAGRKEVIELLKLHENIEDMKKKDDALHYDISWVWGELGLDRE